MWNKWGKKGKKDCRKNSSSEVPKFSLGTNSRREHAMGEKMKNTKETGQACDPPSIGILTWGRRSTF
jgi:hypothetical protein